MPDPQPAAAGQRPQEAEESTFRKFLGIAQQMVMIYAVTQLATKFLFGGNQQGQPVAPATEVNDPSGKPISTTPQAVDPRLLPPTHAHPYWPLGLNMDMYVYLSTSPHPNVFSNRPRQDEGLPEFVWKNITYGDYNDHRVVDYDIKFPDSVLNNGTLWAHIYLTRDGISPNPYSNPDYNPARVHHVRKLLTPYIQRIKIRKEKNLLSSTAGEEEDDFEHQPDVIAPHWHTNVTLALISDASVVQYNSLPPPLLEHIQLVPDKRDETGTKGFYKPIVFPNEFWHLRSHYIQINETTPSLPLRITYQPMSFFKFQIFASMTHGFKEAAKQQGASAGAELDEIKRMLLETNPYFLMLTGVVSILHVVFEMLAFKSDVSHWREKKEMTGVSIVTNVFVQLVILLYLIDNNENTSWMILMGSGMGVLIEAWKITKAVNIKVISSPPGSLLPFKVEVTDKHVLSEDEKKTQEYDQLAFRYVSYVAIPLLAGYTVYSLIYESHRGWYSFIISTLTSFVYMFGFAQLIPQLIINYKLKSVAHMPMKAMVYKTLSTVVDDLFAFCIKMPFLHRLACFRDDVVFLIFLYQRWIYRIDPKRVNEYGQVMESDGDKGESKKDK
ncbi:hypothetical protein CVT24_002131 [Panaeolus cyanescens]|uniref:Cleft lip and palate associated transmembrane protein n=1 Tax=Panaeolus cyanescens TaxID=181874 RepID=A0A409YI15_9AGAR|nr:hypothetical protein CVT24_002131 [Panaeolus cyanescens]